MEILSIFVLAGIILTFAWRQAPSRKLVRAVQQKIDEGEFEVVYRNNLATAIRINGIKVRVFNDFISIDNDEGITTRASSLKTNRMLNEKLGISSESLLERISR